MTKIEYLLELQKLLKGYGVQDIDDILNEYEEHFKFKLADGYAEEEIAKRLGPPEDIAKQFSALATPGAGPAKKNRVLLTCAVGLLSACAVLVFITLFCVVFAIGVSALAIVLLGGCLIAQVNLLGVIPAMPYAGSLLLGLSILGLGILFMVGTVYAWLYFKHFIKVYQGWANKTLHAKVCPPVSLHPAPGAALRRALRNVALICFMLFGVAMVAGMVYLFAYTNFRPFWHELNWFQ